MNKIAERQYLLEPNETASVQVKATGTAHVVAFDLDKTQKGSLGEGQSVEVAKPASGFRDLNLLFTFTGAGGRYVVTITGSHSGSDTDTISQGSFNIPTTAAEYLFQ